MTITRIDTGPRMSQAVIFNNTIYLAGQVGKPGDGVKAQTKTILAEIDRLLAEAGGSKADILSATIWLADIADFQDMNQVWDAWIEGVAAPARATGQSSLATPDYKVEIIIVAAKS